MCDLSVCTESPLYASSLNKRFKPTFSRSGLYLLDIVLNFFTIRVVGDEFHGFHEREESNVAIAISYLKGRFVFDALGSLPLIGQFSANPPNQLPISIS